MYIQVIPVIGFILFSILFSSVFFFLFYFRGWQQLVADFFIGHLLQAQRSHEVKYCNLNDLSDWIIYYGTIQMLYVF